jgi:hypothetical protein
VKGVISWPGVCQKSSWSFGISVIYLQFLRIFSFAILIQLPSFFPTSELSLLVSPQRVRHITTHHPFKPHPHQQVHLTTHFIINPHFSEFIQTMKPATTPLCRSTRNAKDATSSVPRKAPPPSAQALPKTNKKQQTAPSTPDIAPSPSGNLAILSPPLFPIPNATASNTPITTAVTATISAAVGAFDSPGKPSSSSPGKGGCPSVPNTRSHASTAPIVMPTAAALVFVADVSLMTEQAPSALADTASHSAADASAIVSADSTVISLMPEGVLILMLPF